MRRNYGHVHVLEYFFNDIVKLFIIINNYNNNVKKYFSKLYYLHMNQINKIVYVLACISAELYMFSNTGSLKSLLLCQFYCSNHDVNCNVIAPDL